MAEPITEEELADLERVGKDILKRYGAELPEDLPETRLTLRLVAEIRRLRSDEWLEKAAREIAELEVAASINLPRDFETEVARTVREDYMPKFRKYRDSKGETG